MAELSTIAPLKLTYSQIFPSQKIPLLSVRIKPKLASHYTLPIVDGEIPQTQGDHTSCFRRDSPVFAWTAPFLCVVPPAPSV